MIECKKAVEILENAIYGDELSIDYDKAKECLDVLKELCEEKDVHRYEVMATGNVQDIKIFDNVQGNRLVNFLLQKSKKTKDGKWIRGKICCIFEEQKCNVDLRNGDRVRIYGDFSPYTTTRKKDGLVFEKIRIWVERIERLDRGDPNYQNKKDVERYINA